MAGTIYYRAHKPQRRVHIRRISDKTFYTGITIIGLFSAGALYAAYQFFIG